MRRYLIIGLALLGALFGGYSYSSTFLSELNSTQVAAIELSSMLVGFFGSGFDGRAEIKSDDPLLIGKIDETY